VLGYTLDTNTLRPVLRGDERILAKIQSALREGRAVTLNALSYYETHRGLLAAGASRQLERFERLSSELGVLMLDHKALDKASLIYAELRQRGALIEDADLLMAAIAISHDVILVTNNTRHFDRIDELQLNDWLA